MIEILHRKPRHKPRRRALIRYPSGIYYGWTGLEEFGVVWPFRYYGWRVSCWATVKAQVYTDARISLFFDRLETAADELNHLMDVADRMGELSKQPVKYWAPSLLAPPPLWRICDLAPPGNPYVPLRLIPSSPARWRAFARFHNEESPTGFREVALIHGRLIGYQTTPDPPRSSRRKPAPSTSATASNTAPR